MISVHLVKNSSSFRRAQVQAHARRPGQELVEVDAAITTRVDLPKFFGEGLEVR